MSRLLVTGGAGFIGTNFVYYWLDSHPSDRIVVFDALTYAGNRSSLDSAFHSSAFRFVRGDINDQNNVRQLLVEECIDTIVNFAAETHVDRSIEGPDDFIKANILGTHALLKAARSVWLDGSRGTIQHRFHQVSTDEVYGSLAPEGLPFTEVTPYAPNSPYAASKAASDHLVRAYHRSYGLQVTTSNCSNNFGAYQFPEKLLPLFIINILIGQPLPIYGDGSNIRDWLYVQDHCRAIDLVLRAGRVGECYNIGGGAERRNLDMAHSLCRLIDEMFKSNLDLRVRFPSSPAVHGESASLIKFVRDRPGHDHRYSVNTAKIVADLGYKVCNSFETDLQQTVTWYVDNENWWRGIIDGSYRR